MSDIKPDPKAKSSESSELSDLKAKLDAANALIAAKDKEILETKEAMEAQRDSSAQRPVRSGSKKDVVLGEGFRFRVGLQKAHPGLPDTELECCDESEAIRWFILNNAHPDKPGMQIDSSVYPIVAKCIDRRRDVKIKQDKFISVLRGKDERGQTLTEAEQLLLDAENEKVLS